MQVTGSQQGVGNRSLLGTFVIQHPSAFCSESNGASAFLAPKSFGPFDEESVGARRLALLNDN